jgi:hypothetical protein
MMGDKMDHFALTLNAAADGDHIGREYDAAMFFEDLLPDDQIGDSCFILGLEEQANRKPR